MKKECFKFTLKVVILSEIVCCLSFGQTAEPSLKASLKINSLADRNLTPGLKQKLPVIIDFSTMDLQSDQAPDIKYEKREGPGSGGGGNSCALMIKENTRVLIRKIKAYSPLRDNEIYFKNLLDSIRQAKFLLGENLHIHGRKVQAINYPSAKTIVVEESFCNQMDTISLKSMGILLHEYMGLALIDDTEFQVSGDLIAKLNTIGNSQSDSNSLKLDSNASVAQCPSIDGEYIVTGEANKFAKKGDFLFESIRRINYNPDDIEGKHSLSPYSNDNIDENGYSIEIQNHLLFLNKKKFSLKNKEIYISSDPEYAQYFLKYRAGCSNGSIIIELEGANNGTDFEGANSNPIVKRINTYKDRLFIFYKNESTINIVIDSEVYGLDGSLLEKGQKTIELEKKN